MYCTHIRPLLEYGSEVWDGCSNNGTNRLEQIQLNAARIVTGLPSFASLRSLYFETGWEYLEDRRQIRKLTLMYKIVNGDASSYLIDLLPNRVNTITAYNLRNVWVGMILRYHFLDFAHPKILLSVHFKAIERIRSTSYFQQLLYHDSNQISRQCQIKYLIIRTNVGENADSHQT